MNTASDSENSEEMTLSRFAHILAVVVGIVLVWRGIWYALDEADKYFFGGSHFWTAMVGIILGLLILYVPDKNLKEIEKL